MEQNKMYPLVMKSDWESIMSANKENNLEESWLWHLKFGHLHFGGLSQLQQKQMVKGFPTIHEPDNSCGPYIMG